MHPALDTIFHLTCEPADKSPKVSTWGKKIEGLRKDMSQVFK